GVGRPGAAVPPVAHAVGRAAPTAAADRAGMTAFRDITSRRPARLLNFCGWHTHGLVAGGAGQQEKVLRCARRGSVGDNVGAALILAFPSSPLGPFAGLPTPVPPIYGALLAFFVVLFGGAYAWLARQTNIDRPLVALAAIGKAGVFAVLVTFWLLGE